MGICQSTSVAGGAQPQIISCDTRGRIISWKMPKSKNPKLKFFERIESCHQTVKGGCSDLIFAAPRKVYTKDNEGVKVSWEFTDNGKLDQKKVEANVVIKNSTAVAHWYQDHQTEWAFVGYESGSIYQWKLPEKTCFKVWHQVIATPITTLYWNYDTQSLLVGDTGGFQKEFGAPESCYDEPKLIKDWGNIHDDKITCMFLQLDDEELFTVSKGPELKKWSLGEDNYGELLNDYSNLLHKTQIKGIVVNYYGNIVFYSDGRFIRKLNLKSGKHQESYEDHRFAITNIIVAYPDNYKKEYVERKKYREERKKIVEEIRKNEQERKNDKSLHKDDSESFDSDINTSYNSMSRRPLKSPMRRMTKLLLLNEITKKTFEELNEEKEQDISDDSIQEIKMNKKAKYKSVRLVKKKKKVEKTEKQNLIDQNNLSPRIFNKTQNDKDIAIQNNTEQINHSQLALKD